MSDLLSAGESYHASLAESPRELSTNGTLTEVDSPVNDHKPDTRTEEAARAAHGGEEEGSEDEDSDSEGDEGCDDEDDQDDDEPALKYERLAGSVPDLLLKDSASSLAVTDKLIVRALELLFGSN
jgi:hypothetical protein